MLELTAKRSSDVTNIVSIAMALQAGDL